MRVRTSPFSYEIDRRHGVVFLTYGTLQPTAKEWCAVMDRLRADAAFRAGLQLVSDRRLLLHAPSTETVTQMASYVGTHAAEFGLCRWAIVTAPGAPAEFGMVRMARALFERHGSRIDVRPFVDMDTALAWAIYGAREQL